MLCLAVLLTLAGHPAPLSADDGARTAQNTLLNREVDSFNFEKGNLVRALFKLGREQHIPMGIEYVDLDAVGKPISVHLGRTTIGAVVNAILRTSAGYTMRVNGSVLIIGHDKSPSVRRNLLDHVLPRFSIPGRTTLDQASTLLSMLLRESIRPARGYIGDSPPGDMTKRVGPIEMRNVTVRQVLNRLVADYRDAAWVVQVPPASMGYAFWPRGIWRVFGYADPDLQYADELIRSNLEWYGPPASSPR